MNVTDSRTMGEEQGDEEGCGRRMAKNSSSTSEGLEAAPHYRIVESEEGVHKFEITYDVGGFKPDDVRITLENDNKNLVVTAKKEEKKGNSTIAREFKRQLEVPSSVDANKFQCFWDKKGLLKVIAPLAFDNKSLEPEQQTPIFTPSIPNISMEPSLMKTSTQYEGKNDQKVKPKRESSSNKKDISIATKNRKIIHHDSKADHNGEKPCLSDKLEKLNFQISSGSRSRNKGSRQTAEKSEKIMRSPQGNFFQLEISLPDVPEKSDDMLIEISDSKKIVKAKFTVTESNSSGWDETREIVRSIKLPENLDYINIHQSKAFVNSEQKLLKVLIPTSGKSLEESYKWKELRTKVTN